MILALGKICEYTQENEYQLHEQEALEHFRNIHFEEA
jgi:hypothetical protein